MSDLSATLGLSSNLVPQITEIVEPTNLDGLGVCFTGPALIVGQLLERRDLKALLQSEGFSQWRALP